MQTAETACSAEMTPAMQALDAVFNALEQEGVSSALASAAALIAAGVEWRVFIYAYAFGVYMFVRGMGVTAAFMTVFITSLFGIALGWHGLAPVLAILIALELRLAESRHARALELAELRHARDLEMRAMELAEFCKRYGRPQPKAAPEDSGPTKSEK